MTNEILNWTSRTLKWYDYWHIFTHKKADGDAIGSATALFEAGVNLNKHVKWYSPDEKLPETYRFLPHFDEHIYTESFSFGTFQDYRYRAMKELYIFLDCANETRSVEGYDAQKQINAVNIDHHEDNSFYGRVNCVYGKASSTCEVLCRIFKAGRWEITKNIAESLYTGIFTDTGSFTFSNTSPITHRILAELIEHGAEPSRMTDMISQNKSVPGFKVWSKALSRAKTFGPEDIFAISFLSADDFREAGADLTENEGLPSMLMTLRGVKFIAMLTENLKGEIRASFRSREGSPFGAGEFARLLGGGGHERASGSFVEFGTLNECVNEIESLMLKKYNECSYPDK